MPCSFLFVMLFATQDGRILELFSFDFTRQNYVQM